LVFKSSFLAGICIGIAGFAYLAVGGVAGAALFAFGLLTVVNYSLKLYTGTAGFISRKELPLLMFILLGNIVGCLAVSLLARVSALDICEKALGILESRLSVGAWKAGLLSIGCGFIMTTAVTFARKGSFLPLLFGVPVFIVCGFPHCVADAFYYLCCPLSFLSENIINILPLYLCIVAGNFIGCNLYRMLRLG